ncbi:hypothetical protein C8R47DRAFT_1219813 [Mycena vitilis]|nr:hypothetical protein C8R47DRAFT_1219813 [Mycena vitilis]
MSGTKGPAKSDTDELLAAFDGLNIGPAGPRPRLPPPSHPAPRTPPKRKPAYANEEDRLYHVSSPTHDGYTTSWDVAAQLTQGVSGAVPRRLSPKKKTRSRKGGYVVFFGRVPGPYRTWAEVEPLVTRVSGNLHQAYPTFEEGQAAYEYAVKRGWTRVCPHSGPTPSPPIGSLPTPTSLDHTNPLHVPGDPTASHQGLWYIVFSGVTPGVYQSSLECALNTVGMKGAVFHHCDNRDVAEQLFNEARDGDRINVVTPLYYN